MDIREKSEELVEDRVFLGIFLTGVLISFIVSVNQISFPAFLGFFLSGSFVSLLAAVSWRGIETGYLRVLAVLAVFLISGSAGIFYLQGQSSCLAWSAHSAENPVTNTCHAYVYGGCGPTPEPWYYNQCSPESEERLCERLENSAREESEKLHERLCTEYPDLNLSVVNYDSENETLELRVTESEFNLSNTDKLRIEPWENRSFRISHDGRIYNTSVLIAENKSGIFNDSLDVGDEFTIVYDGTDSDEDSRAGADFDGDLMVYVFEWWNSRYNGTAVAVAQNFRERGLEVSQIY